MKDKSRLGCKGSPVAYDADVCEDCIYDEHCYDIFLKSSERFIMGTDLATGKDKSVETKWLNGRIISQQEV